MFFLIGDTENIPSFTSIKRLKLIIKNHHVPLRKSILTVFILTNHYCKLVEGLESRWHCAPMKDQHAKKENFNALKLVCQYSKHEMKKTGVVNEFNDLEDLFSLKKEKSHFN